MNDNNSIKKHLEDTFKKLLPPDAAPEALKREVFSTLDTLDLIADIADLFTSKFTKSEASFLEMLSESEPDEQNNTESKKEAE